VRERHAAAIRATTTTTRTTTTTTQADKQGQSVKMSDDQTLAEQNEANKGECRGVSKGDAKRGRQDNWGA